MKQQHKLSIKEKICYGLGDSSANIFLGMTMMFLPYFYTDVLGISAAAMGILFIVARLVDAFYDPFIGNISDRTRTKHGSYRPFLLWLAIPYGISCFLVFLAPDFFTHWKASLCSDYLSISDPDVCLHGGAVCGVVDDTHRRSHGSFKRQLLAFPTGKNGLSYLLNGSADFRRLVWKNR